MSKKIFVTDTILRDAHQSLLATRMRTEDMLPICDKLDKVGYWSLECWGGATFDACVRFLKEDPWERLRQLRAALPNTRLQMLLRGQNLLTLVADYRLAQQVAAIAGEVGAVVLNDYEGTSLDAIRQMAGMGMGLALLPELYVRQEVRDGDDVTVRPFNQGRQYREIGLLWRIGAGRAPAYHLIADLLRAVGP